LIEYIDAIQFKVDKKNCEQNHIIYVKNIKRHNTYAYKYDYIQTTEILMFSDLQRCTTQNSLIEYIFDQS